MLNTERIVPMMTICPTGYATRFKRRQSDPTLGAYTRNTSQSRSGLALGSTLTTP
jgi:hypothetical protein